MRNRDWHSVPRTVFVRALLMALTFALPLAVVGVSSSARAEAVFVQSVKAALKSEPKMSANDVASLARGDELEVLQTQGAWVQVKKGESTGWVSKLFVNKNKPIGAASLANEVPVSEAKTSRRRESSYAVSAATRGLMPVQRTRAGRDEYRSNNQALDSVERLVIAPEELDQFQKDGNLNQ